MNKNGYDAFKVNSNFIKALICFPSTTLPEAP